jgi:UDP-N-acetylglucosamine 2-epimerase
MPDSKIKVTTIVGARPQFVKAATVSRAIATHNINSTKPVIEETIIHTGQHYDEGMSSIFFRELNIPVPAYNLGIGSGSHGLQTGKMLMAIEEILIKNRPDLVLVYGDTNSTLAGALAAAKLKLSVAHIEAGLRSFIQWMPEEINRVLTDKISRFLLCPSHTAVYNLQNEGITTGVSYVGDVMYDALKYVLSGAVQNSGIIERLGLKEKNYLLVTVHRAENTDDPYRLKNIMAALDQIDETIIMPVHPRTKKQLNKVSYTPKSHIILTEPYGYIDMISLAKSARMLLTDSGGMQKEAYWLKVPCMTLRFETEWMETVEAGWNVLAGSNTERILEVYTNFSLRGNVPKYHPNIYGDGNAAANCIRELVSVNNKAGVV